MAPAAGAPRGGARRGAREWTQDEIRAAVAEGRYMYTCEGRVYDVQVEALMHPGGRDVSLPVCALFARACLPRGGGAGRWGLGR